MKFLCPRANRLSREKRTVTVMIRLYCAHHHHDSGEGECRCHILEKYAHDRLDHCRHGASKPSCRRCTTHCYSPDMKQLMLQVMRWSGPRMLWRHPLMTLRHLLHR